jgi:hypothetical protein
VRSFWSRKWGEWPRFEYIAWYQMNRRCYSPKHPSFDRYGGRGIGVCDRWRDDFMAFFSDMGVRPSPAYSLDRIDNDANYGPDNCRWATYSQQRQNSGLVLDAVGARREGKRWRVNVKVGRRSVHLGCFATFAEARLVYRRAVLHRRLAAEIAAAEAEAARIVSRKGKRNARWLDRRLLDILSDGIFASRSAAAVPQTTTGIASRCRARRGPLTAPPGRPAARRR